MSRQVTDTTGALATKERKNKKLVVWTVGTVWAVDLSLNQEPEGGPL